MGEFRHGRATHTGRVRELNEDSYVADPSLGLWIVADGMGGHECGEVASRIAADFIHEQVAQGLSLPAAAAKAHEVVTLAAREGLGQQGMGSTLVALQLDGPQYRVVWVGDSRAYLWRDGGLTQLTRDHSFVQRMVDEGQITSAEAINHPFRNVITQALGVADLDEVEVGEVAGTLRASDRIMLCSDGLSAEVPETEIARLLDSDADPQAQAQALVEAALDHGGSDNVTVLLVEVDPDGVASVEAGSGGQQDEFTPDAAHRAPRPDANP